MQFPAATVFQEYLLANTAHLRPQSEVFDDPRHPV
jgi:hypothetical protein